LLAAEVKGYVECTTLWNVGLAFGFSHPCSNAWLGREKSTQATREENHMTGWMLACALFLVLESFGVSGLVLFGFFSYCNALT